jgi:hypothetical protein
MDKEAAQIVLMFDVMQMHMQVQMEKSPSYLVASCLGEDGAGSSLEQVT